MRDGRLRSGRRGSDATPFGRSDGSPEGPLVPPFEGLAGFRRGGHEGLDVQAGLLPENRHQFVQYFDHEHIARSAAAAADNGSGALREPDTGEDAVSNHLIWVADAPVSIEFRKAIVEARQ